MMQSVKDPEERDKAIGAPGINRNTLFTIVNPDIQYLRYCHNRRNKSNRVYKLVQKFPLLFLFRAIKSMGHNFTLTCFKTLAKRNPDLTLLPINFSSVPNFYYKYSFI